MKITHPAFTITRTRIIVAAIALLVVVGISFANASTPIDTFLQVSQRADRVAAPALDGNTVSGNIYVYAPSPGVRRVNFYLDATGSLSRARITSRETSSPFDFAHTASNGNANPFNTTTLADGTHTISALVYMNNGSKQTHVSTFTVKNNVTTVTTTAPVVTTTKPPVTTTAPPVTTPVTAPPVTTPVTPAGSFGVKVANAQFTDLAGNPITLRGVNRAGTEFSCSQSAKFTSDGYLGQAINGSNIAYADTEAKALLAWDKAGSSVHAISTVRIPLNEDCWLGINGVASAVAGTNYQNFIKRLVTDLTAQHMNVVLDLHWAAPGTWLPGMQNGAAANGQNVAPDADHSVEFWKEVATQYKSSPNVLFDLFNEPGISCNAGSGCPTAVLNGGYIAQDNWAWNLYRDGGSYTYNSGLGDMYSSRVGQTFQIAGTQQLTNTIRATGATNVIIVETLGWGNGYIDMMGSHMPTDSLNQVAASIHSYDFSGYNAGTPSGIANMDSTLLNGKDANGNGVTNITGRYPFFLGEFGTTGSCGSNGTNSAFTKSTMDWLELHHYGYTAWGWDQGEGCYGPTLVSNDDTGAPSLFGADVKAELQTYAK